MEVAFLPIDLQRWDQVSGDLFVVCLWSDIRPLRGAAGLLDWRLNGKLSRWIEEGRMAGRAGEKTLVPTARIPWRTVLALGLGPSREFSESQFLQAVDAVFATARGLKLRTVAMALAGRDIDRVTPERALDLVIEAGRADPVVERFTVVDNPAALRLMAEADAERAAS
jgi:hypothetical protein